MARSSARIQVDEALTADISKSEWQIIRTVGSGMSNKEIAKELCLSEGTVRNTLSNILCKLNLRDRTQLAIWAGAGMAAAGFASGRLREGEHSDRRRVLRQLLEHS